MSDSEYIPIEKISEKAVPCRGEKERSKQRRASCSLSKGEKARMWGRHSYLTDEEKEDLIVVIQQWDDDETQPEVDDLPTLVFSLNIVDLIFFVIGFLYQKTTPRV
jgi:hypothetical protein